MNIIAVCVYNRIENIKHLFHCWAQCKHDATLVIVHNYYGVKQDMEAMKAVCDAAGVLYVPRNKPGFDIGAFQDVCKGRLPGFPEWDNLLWMCDDTFIMQKDFYQPFFEQLRDPKIGVCCMEISPYVRRHIRTTGFAIRKETAQQLKWPADPITTKEDCYQFEHRSKNLTFYDQITQMGLKVVMPAMPTKSPLYDTGYHRRIKTREPEHFRLFGRVAINNQQPTKTQQLLNELPLVTDHLPKVVFICPIFDKYPQIVSALICQTYQNWELWLIHDGPEPLNLPDDNRIIYEKRERKGNDWGHSFRKEYLQKVNSPYVVITNADNYYAPVFIERCLQAFSKSPRSIAVYCSHIIHSYTDWKVMTCRFQRGFIDCGQVMLKTEPAAKVGWRSMEHSADWEFFNDIAKAYGRDKFSIFNGCYFTHN